PWGAPEEVKKLSPVDASTEYLRHLRQAWDARLNAKKKPEVAFGEQHILPPGPASFAEGARELTLRAAEAAGLRHVTLLEEPQAAFYAWIDAQGEAWRKSVELGDAVLICDVGGGTTDLTLIAVAEEEGNLVLTRVAVGDHILLGGDNMDLALAHTLGQAFG